MTWRLPSEARPLSGALALLLGMLAGCSDSANRPLDHDAGGSRNEAGTNAEPTGSDSAGEGTGGGAGGGGNTAGQGSSEAGDGGAELAGNGAEGGAGGEPAAPLTSAYGETVESFEPGTGAGYNQDKMPGIVLGPPAGKGASSGSLDVVSLGAGGEIVLAFGELGIVDGPGPDLVVFENAFWPNGEKAAVFAELGEVSVSQDGQTWQAFPCDTEGDGEGNFPGCAGVTPTLVYDAAALSPLDPALSGGDAFDLADLGLSRARFVKIRDLETMPPGGTTTGFDLDAVAAIHAQ